MHADGRSCACLDAFARALESHAAATLGSSYLLPVHRLQAAQRSGVRSGVCEAVLDGEIERRSSSVSSAFGPDQPNCTSSGEALSFDARRAEVVEAGSMLDLVAVTEVCLQRAVRTATLLLGTDLVLPFRQTRGNRLSGAATGMRTEALGLIAT